MDTRSVVVASMVGARNNQGSDVVLYLASEKADHRVGGRHCWLPVMAVENTDGYVEFLPQYQDRIAAWFGDDEDQAQEKVDEINEEFGYDPAAAIALVGMTMPRAAERDHEAGAKLKR